VSEPHFDVIMQGTVFFDIVLTGLPALPTQGTELLAEGMGSCPGGIANLAVAASRLGLRTALAAVFGDDVYGDFLWRTLAGRRALTCPGPSEWRSGIPRSRCRWPSSGTGRW
jgi:sugar/nucleoside kinase (ribokinase family)